MFIFLQNSPRVSIPKRIKYFVYFIHVYRKDYKARYEANKSNNSPKYIHFTSQDLIVR